MSKGVGCISKGLERLCLTHNWTKTETRVHGEYRGFWFNAASERGLFTLETVYPFAPEQLNELLGKLRHIKVPRLKTQVIGNERATALYLIGSAELTYEELDRLINRFCDELVAVGIPEESSCGSCGKPGSYPVAELGPEKTFPMCEPCFAQGQIDLQETKERLGKANFQYLRGSLGALAGGIVAAVPWIIVEQIGFTGAFLAYFIGKGALKGYVVLGGQVGPRTPRIIVAVTGLLVLLSHLTALGLTLEPGYSWFSFRFILELTHTPELAWPVWGGLALGLFTSGIGVQQAILDIQELTTVPDLKRI